MNDHKDIKKVQLALNTTFSDLKDDPWLAQKVLAKAKGEIKVKKRLSVGFVLVIALVLAAVTALAAMTLNAYYEKAIEKEGKSGLIQDWNTTDKVALVDWMVEAGVELDESQVAQLHSADLSEGEQGALAMEIINGYYPARDGILTSVDIIAKEKGPIEYWSLEDKAWFSEMMAKYQPEEVSGVNLLPTDADITQEQAVEIMYAFFEKEYGLKREDFDESKMSISFSENTWDDGSGPQRLKTWSMNLWLKADSEHPMGIYILPDGTVKQASGPYVSNWHDEWNKTFMSPTFQTIQGKSEFQRVWSIRIQQLQNEGVTLPTEHALYRFLNRGFTLPSENDISEEQAIRIANAAILATLEWEDDRLQYYIVSDAAYCSDRPEGGYYWFIYGWNNDDYGLDQLDQMHNAGQLPYSINVKIAGATGSIVEVRACNTPEEIYSK